MDNYDVISNPKFIQFKYYVKSTVYYKLIMTNISYFGFLALTFKDM